MAILRNFRERKRAQWEGQMERERKSQADSILSVEPNVGLDLKIKRLQFDLKPRVGAQHLKL